jgi:hypothetical protein
MSLPLSIDDVKPPFQTIFGSGFDNINWAVPTKQHPLYRAAQQAEWAHLLAVEALWLIKPGNVKAYAGRLRNYEQSLAAYNAEFNPKAE